MSVSADRDGGVGGRSASAEGGPGGRANRDPGGAGAASAASGASAEDRPRWDGVRLAGEAEGDDAGDDCPGERAGGGEGARTEAGDRESSPQEERLLEELIRLRLASQPEATASQLPPKQRIQLYQPRTKLEQLEDILIESQLLEQSGFTKGLEEALAAAADPSSSSSLLDGVDLDLLRQCRSIDSIDFEVSDAIFSDAFPTRSRVDGAAAAATDMGEDKVEAKESALEVREGALKGRGEESDKGDCACSSCHERQNIESEQLQEVERLRECWSELREEICLVYTMVLDGSWSDPAKIRPDLQFAKDRVHKLCWKDAHQLYLRLEAGVKEFVLQIKLNLIELLQKQAKNPSLAQDFIQSLLSGYEKLCNAAREVTPALMSLEIEHLRRFSLTWEILNKHLYQSIIYSDPLIQNNVPIFISQLRSLYPDKEHELRYTELVRGYLDFDVEMGNICDLWKSSEKLIQDYNQQQSRLREKQKMLKDDWERFKAQQKDLKRIMKQSRPSSPGVDTGLLVAAADSRRWKHEEIMSVARLGESLSSVLDGLEELGLDGVPASMEYDLRRAMNLQSPTPEPSSVSAALPVVPGVEPFSACSVAESPTLEQQQQHLDLLPSEEELVEELFRSAVSVDGDDLTCLVKEASFSSSPYSERFQELSGQADDAKDLSKLPCSSTDDVSVPSSSEVCRAKFEATTSIANPDAAANAFAKLYPSIYSALMEDADSLVRKANLDLEADEDGDASSAAKSLSSLFPSLLTAEGLRTRLGIDDDDSGKLAAELSEALSTALSLAVEKDAEESRRTMDGGDLSTSDGVKCQSKSSGERTSTSMSHSSATISTKAIPNSTSKSSGPKATPGGSKAASATNGSSCKGVHHHGNKEINKLLHQHYCGTKPPPPPPSAKAVRRGKVPPPPEPDPLLDDDEEDFTDEDDDYESSVAEDTCSSSSTSVAAGGDAKNCPCCYCELFGHGGQTMAPVSRNYPEMRERLRLLLKKKNRQHNSKSGKAVPRPATIPSTCQAGKPAANHQHAQAGQDQVMQQVKHKTQLPTTTASASKVPIVPPVKKSQDSTESQVLKTKNVDDILDFIEGNQKIVNEKKKAKKERQKLQRLEEQRKREEQERKRREAEEAERKRREEEEKQAQEMARQMLKKQKKKAAQRAKKAAAKGIDSQDADEPSENTSLEEMKMQQMMEIQRLKMMHQQQLEEEERKLQQLIQQTKGNSSFQAPKIPSTTLPSRQPAVAPVVQTPSLGGGPQIKITRTPDGGVKFTPVTEPVAVPTQAQQRTTASSENFYQSQNLRPSFASSSGAGMQFSPASFIPGMAMQQPQQAKPVIPSLSGGSGDKKSDQPMVTIKRVSNSNSGEPTVTISARGELPGKKAKATDSKNEKLLYTVINGQIHRCRDAPANLIPDAKPLQQSQEQQILKLTGGAQSPSMSKKQRKKLKKQSRSASDDAESPDARPEITISSSSGRVVSQAADHGTMPSRFARPQQAPLPKTKDGKIDLDRLDLPPGISITKIEGPVPERKYFPERPSQQPTEQLQFMPGKHPAQQPHPPAHPGVPQQQPHFSQSVAAFAGAAQSNAASFNQPVFGGYHATPTVGYPSMNDFGSAVNPNASNVIVVDTSALSSKEGEEQQSKSKKKKGKKGKGKGGPETASNTVIPPAGPTSLPGSGFGLPGSVGPQFLPSGAPNTGSSNSDPNSLKKGPQVLIKNVNGKVVITPVPGTGATNIPNGLNGKGKAVATTTKETIKAKAKKAGNGSQVSVNGIGAANDVNGKNGKLHKNGEKATEASNLSNHTHVETAKKTMMHPLEAGGNFDEITSVFEPKSDLDLDNGDMDDDERELEAFKRFCFNSVPQKEKPKVKIDLKSLKKKN